MELPVSYEKKMQELLKNEFQAYEKCLETPVFRGLRVNTGKIGAEEFERISPFPCGRISWIPNGYYIPEEAKASRHPYYGAGLFYLQEPSAMTPARMLPVKPGDKVLDLCAAPGGKATELAARVGPTGLLAANDISSSRARGLLKNLELLGFPHILVTGESPERLAGYFPEYFDKILVDAPCSGEGMFRREPSMQKSWKERGPEHYVPIQREILRQAARMLGPGGLLLYSTCTFDPRENEGAVQFLLDEEPDFSVVSPGEEMEKAFQEAGFCPGRPDASEGGREELAKCFRIYPHKVKGEGHFLALLRKEGKALKGKLHKGEFQKGTSLSDRGVSMPEALVRDFLGKLGEGCLLRLPFPAEAASFPYRLRILENRAYLEPACLPSLRGLRILRTGCYLGEIRKTRFEPSQALAMALKKEDWPLVIDLPAGDSRVFRYLKGETPDLGETEGPDGWYLFCVDGFPLGWCKRAGGAWRNKYYSGWRW